MEGGIIIKLRNQLLEERKRLEKVRHDVCARLKDAPEGTLRLSKSQGCTQFYYRQKGQSHNGSYIPRKDIELVRSLAQKAYDEKLLDYAEKTLKNINRLLETYADEKLEEIYFDEHPARQKLIDPIEPTYEQRVAEWSGKPYEGKGFAEGTPVILTNSGIRVRSKSEKILADYFDSVGIAYKYECPLNLKGYGTVYPDFTFLPRGADREIYWEHEGMMDNPDYSRSAIQKIETYAKNGIVCGENLILTFETSASTINMGLVKMMAKKYLI